MRLEARADLERFFETLPAAPSRVLLLDYDGTLAPLTEDRDRAYPYPEAIELLRRIQADGGTRLVVISGRAVANLRPLLGMEPPPELWGTHGWERLRPGGPLETGRMSREVQDALERAARAAARVAPEERVERKPASVAVHVRGLSERDAERLLEAVRAAWAPLESGALEARAFDGGAELRVRGRDKGTAVEVVLSEEPQGCAAAYLGDDLTDEDAFRALAGRGLSVLVRAEPRETLADVWIRPPEGLIDFLTRWREAAAVRGVGA